MSLTVLWHFTQSQYVAYWWNLMLHFVLWEQGNYWRSTKCSKDFEINCKFELKFNESLMITKFLKIMHYLFIKNSMFIYLNMLLNKIYIYHLPLSFATEHTMQKLKSMSCNSSYLTASPVMCAIKHVAKEWITFSLFLYFRP